jgi:hypothetical protein
MVFTEKRCRVMLSSALSPSWSYVVSDVFEYPFLRPSPDQHLEFWDVPKRPEEGSYRLHAIDSETEPSPVQIRTINLDSLVGLTFFCAGKSIKGIYPHKSPDSSPFEAFNALGSVQPELTFVRYFPLNSGQETINQIWVVENYSLQQGISRTLTVRAQTYNISLAFLI